MSTRDCLRSLPVSCGCSQDAAASTSAKQSQQERLGFAQGASGLPSPSQKLKTEVIASAVVNVHIAKHTEQAQLAVCLFRRMQRPLTSAKRSHQERLGAAQGGSGLPSPSQKLKTEAVASASAASLAARAAIGPMPGDDLPPVIAPPGRSA